MQVNDAIQLSSFYEGQTRSLKGNSFLIGVAYCATSGWIIRTGNQGAGGSLRAFQAFSKLRQFSISEPFSHQPPVTRAVGQLRSKQDFSRKYFQ